MNNGTEYRVLRSVGGLFELLCEADGHRTACRARGVLRRDEGRVLVGDRVRIENEASDHVIAEVLPRKNRLIRPPLANLDEFFVVAAVCDPLPVKDTLDKLFVILEHNAIEATFVVTKSDLDPPGAEALASLYRGAGYRTFCVSSYTGEGVDALAAYVSTRLGEGAALALGGASGVGKSSLINRLFPTLALHTGEISRKTARGKNTTRVCELFPLMGGFLADTPGFSLLDFLRFDFLSCEDLAPAFREFVPLLDRCRYSDCRHIKEEECAIRRAVAEGKIATSRYESYCALYPLLREKKRNLNK